MVLIVGFGRLAQSFVSLIDKEEEILVYNRSEEKVAAFAKQDKRVKVAESAEFSNAKLVLLMLPGDEIENFLHEYKSAFSTSAIFYNFATAKKTDTLDSLLTKRKVVPCKCIGHAKQMKKDRKGLFVIPNEFEKEKQQLEIAIDSSKIEIIYGSEQDALVANSEATKAAITMIVSLQKKLQEANVPKKIIEHTISQTTRGMISAYQTNDLGGFAKKIKKELEDQIE